MLCQSGSLVYDNGRSGVAVTLRCRSWRCPDCQPIRRAIVIRAVLCGRATRFITLTVNPRNYDSPEERAAKLAEAWRIVVKRIKRRFKPREFEYMAVFEATKRGEPHLHILLRSPYISQQWLSEQMDELIGAPIVDVRKVENNKHLAFYLAKYVGKDLHKFGTCKRYWSTRNFAIDSDNGESNPWKGCKFERRAEGLEDVENHWKYKEGRAVWRISEHCIVADEPFSRWGLERTRAPPLPSC